MNILKKLFCSPWRGMLIPPKHSYVSTYKGPRTAGPKTYKSPKKESHPMGKTTKNNIIIINLKTDFRM